MPFAPGTEYRGDQYLFQGIAGAGAKMGNAVEQVINKYKQAQDAGKAADYFRKALGENAAMVTGVHDEQWKTLGSQDKAQAMVGLIQAQGAKQAQQQQQMTAMKLKEMLDTQKKSDAFSADVSQMMGGAAPGFNPMAPGQEGAPAEGAATPQINGDQLLQLYLKHGLPMGNIDDVGRALRAVGDTQQPALQFQEDPVSGVRFGTLKNTVMPSGINPKKAQANIEDVHDEQGNVIGQAMRDPRSGKLIQWNNKTYQGHIEIPNPDNPITGGKLMLPLDIAKKEYPDLYKKFMATSPEPMKAPPTEEKPGFFQRIFGGKETPTTPKAPAKGEVRNGYKFNGGNPADPNSWEKVK